MNRPQRVGTKRISRVERAKGGIAFGQRCNGLMGYQRASVVQLLAGKKEVFQMESHSFLQWEVLRLITGFLTI